MFALFLWTNSHLWCCAVLVSYSHRISIYLHIYTHLKHWARLLLPSCYLAFYVLHGVYLFCLPCFHLNFLQSIDFLSTVIDNQDVAAVLLQPLIKLGLVDYVISLLASEIEKLSDESKFDRCREQYSCEVNKFQNIIISYSIFCYLEKKYLACTKFILATQVFTIYFGKFSLVNENILFDYLVFLKV